MIKKRDMKRERTPAQLAESCRNFAVGAKKLYEGKGDISKRAPKGDMWFAELFWHLHECADALTESPTLTEDHQ